LEVRVQEGAHSSDPTYSPMNKLLQLDEHWIKHEGGTSTDDKALQLRAEERENMLILLSKIGIVHWVDP
jgi:hypothetical protein